MEYKHFSHQHALTVCKLQPGQQYRCHGCHLQCHDSIFACWNCNFFLHDHCGNANRYTNHPSHTMHPLVLMSSPTCCSGSFFCNTCGAPGSTFSYCCPLCEVDLHVHCAFLPPKVSHRNHQHEIYLSFRTPDRPNSPDYCKICRIELNSKNWSYFCEQLECDFRVHTFCATTEVKPGLYQDDRPIVNENTSTNQTHVRTELTPEELIHEMSRLQMEFQMAQALSNVIAYFPTELSDQN